VRILKEADRHGVLTETPERLAQEIVELTRPLVLKERSDLVASPYKPGPVAPLTI
jgi:hypothetical protein